MNRLKFVVLSAVMLGLLLTYNQKDQNTPKHNDCLSKTDYLSIDGLWKCTPETGLKLEKVIPLFE